MRKGYLRRRRGRLFFQSNDERTKRARPVYAPRKLWQEKRVIRIILQKRQKTT